MASEQVLNIPVRRHVLTSERPFQVVLDGIYDGISQPDIGALFATLAALAAFFAMINDSVIPPAATTKNDLPYGAPAGSHVRCITATTHRLPCRRTCNKSPTPFLTTRRILSKTKRLLG